MISRYREIQKSCRKKYGMNKVAADEGFAEAILKSLGTLTGPSVMGPLEQLHPSYSGAGKLSPGFKEKFHDQAMAALGRQAFAPQEAQPPSFLDQIGSSAAGGLTSGVGSLAAAPLAGLSTGISKTISNTLAAPATTFGYRLDKALNSGFGGLMDRIHAPDVAAKSFIETSTANMANKATDLLADMTSKAVSGISDLVAGSPARKAILEQLRNEDEILSQMPQQDLLDAYHSITKFAPELAKDKNAVRSALRMAAQTEGGMSYHVIKGLAEAESAVNKAKQGR